MVNKEVLTQKLTQLKEYIGDLEEAKLDSNFTLDNFISDKKIKRYIERTLHLAIECCLDIGSHIIADEGYRQPQSNKDVFQILCENKIIPQDNIKSLQKMAQFRNLLVHDYIRIDPETVYGIVKKNLSDISDFSQEMKRLL